VVLALLAVDEWTVQSLRSHCATAGRTVLSLREGQPGTTIGPFGSPPRSAKHSRTYSDTDDSLATPLKESSGQ